MLRRIKKDVELEIGEKVSPFHIEIQVEKEIYCDLSARQKYTYDLIKNYLHAGLLQNVASQLRNQGFQALSKDANVKNLMNLVMQFRKVFLKYFQLEFNKFVVWIFLGLFSYFQVEIEW